MRYLKARAIPFRALVAFSGTVDDGGPDYTEANMNGFPEIADGRDLQARRVPPADRRREVPDRLRPAAAAHHVRGQEAGRRQRGADPLPPEPHPPGQGRDHGAGLRQRGRGDPEGVPALLRAHDADRGHRPQPALRPADASWTAFRFYTPRGRGPLRRASTSTRRAPGQALRGPGAGRGPLRAAAEDDRTRSAATSRTTCGSTPSSSQVLTFTDADAGEALRLRPPAAAAACRPGARSCRWRSSGTSTWSPTGCTTTRRQDRARRGKRRGRTGRSRAAERPGATTRSSRSRRSSSELNERFGTDFSEEDRVFIQQLEEHWPPMPRWRRA